MNPRRPEECGTGSIANIPSRDGKKGRLIVLYYCIYLIFIFLFDFLKLHVECILCQCILWSGLTFCPR